MSGVPVTSHPQLNQQGETTSVGISIHCEKSSQLEASDDDDDNANNGDDNDSEDTIEDKL